MDFFKLRKIEEEHGAGDEGTPSLVAKYKAGTPGQTSAAPTRQSARKGDKLNAKMDYSSKVTQKDIAVKNTMKEESDLGEELKHDRYLRSHGKKASGTGSWMFTTKPMGSVDYKNSEEVYSADRNMKLSDAAKAAQKALGAKTVYVMEAFEDPEAQKAEMALTKLHFIKYAAEEIMEYIEMDAPIEEWYQIKLAKVHADMEGLHSYMEGEKRRTGMAESTEVNEISKKTLGSYVKRASQDAVTKSMKYGAKSDESGSHTKDLNKINKREAGIRKATDRLTKEEMKEGENKQMKGKDPCWKGYQMVGTKKKGGKEVPNCVPVSEAKMENSEVLSAAKSLAANGKDEKTKSFGKGLVDFYNKNNGFTPDQVAGLQNIMKNASFQMAKEGVMKNIKRQLTATDADSRAGEEATKMMKAQQSGDNASAAKHDKRLKRFQSLTKKEDYVSAAQRKAVWASKNEKGVTEKLDPSMGAGEYVKDFQKSDAPQFKGKSKKERQEMAVAAYLAAKRGE